MGQDFSLHKYFKDQYISEAISRFNSKYVTPTTAIPKSTAEYITDKSKSTAEKETSAMRSPDFEMYDKDTFHVLKFGRTKKDQSLFPRRKDADGNYVDPVWFYGVFPDSSVSDFPWVEDWNNLPDTVSMAETDGWAAGYLDHDPTNSLNDRF